MIPLNIEDPVVLRRTLEELEAKIIVVTTPISAIDQIPVDADLLTTVAKLNEVIGGFNAVAKALNETNTSDRP